MLIVNFRMILGKDNASYWSVDIPLYRSMPTPPATEEPMTWSEPAATSTTTSGRGSTPQQSATTKRGDASAHPEQTTMQMTTRM